MIDDEIRRLARLLEALVKVEKMPVRELERRLGFGGGTLNRIFSGRIELKVRHILLVLDALGVKPMSFFEKAFRTPEGEEEKTAEWLLSAVESLRRRPQPQPEPPTEKPAMSEEDLRRVVVEVVRELGLLPAAPARKASRAPK